MKEICAVIRINKINETKRALSDAGFPSMTVRKTLGRGKGDVEYLIQPGHEQEFEPTQAASERGPKLIPKRMITLIVPDTRKDAAVAAIIQANQTGKPGDGKIFVMPILDAARVRTAERGDTAVDEQS
jgi:nitrogen regulatory protein PII 2